jgi:hypothetical protein
LTPNRTQNEGVLDDTGVTAMPSATCAVRRRSSEACVTYDGKIWQC